MSFTLKKRGHSVFDVVELCPKVRSLLVYLELHCKTDGGLAIIYLVHCKGTIVFNSFHSR